MGFIFHNQPYYKNHFILFVITVILFLSFCGEVNTFFFRHSFNVGGRVHEKIWRKKTHAKKIFSITYHRRGQIETRFFVVVEPVVDMAGPGTAEADTAAAAAVAGTVVAAGTVVVAVDVVGIVAVAVEVVRMDRLAVVVAVAAADTVAVLPWNEGGFVVLPG